MIPTGAWHDYLQWYRRVLALPCATALAATAIAPGELDDGTLPAGDALHRPRYWRRASWCWLPARTVRRMVDA